jgi:hypothetical protein
MARLSNRSIHKRGWCWAALILGALFSGSGCNPQSLAFLFLPFTEDTVDAKVDLTKGKKEPTLVILASFANPLEVSPEFQSVDRELTERLSQSIVARFAHNKRKVKIVPYYKVKSYLNKDGDGLTAKLDVGKHFGADYVICLEINEMRLYPKNSPHQLFQGHTEMTVVVFDVNKESEPIFEDIYRTEFPTTGAEDAGGSSDAQLRTIFLMHVGKDLSKWFASYPTSDRFDSMNGPFSTN